MKNIIIHSIVLFLGITLISCESKAENTNSTASPSPNIAEVSPVTNKQDYKAGDQVPDNLVCMVNDAYMGRKQMEVPFDGKMYYGCCDNCVERIPNDPSVRHSSDPLTGKEVDKANAYIVLMNETNGQVAYFENQQNYENFIKKQ